LKTLDGLNVWEALSNDTESPRKSILHNIDDIWGSAALTVGNWKILKGTNYKGAWDGWYGPSGERNPKLYDVNMVLKSLAGKAIKSLKLMPSTAEILRLRHQATIDCSMMQPYLRQGGVCDPQKMPCLFNIQDDPCEHYNMAER